MAQTAAEEDPSWIVRVFRRVFASGEETDGEAKAAAASTENHVTDETPDPEPAMDEMRERVKATIQLPPDAVERLAQDRAKAVAQVLTGAGVSEARITVAPSVAPPEHGRPIVRFGLDEAGPGSD